MHSFYHCSESKCHYQKEKGRKKFNHAWIFRRDLCYDSTTGLWWLLFVQQKGMFCLLCRLHQAKSKHNKSVSYRMEPAVRFQSSALNEHCSEQKHQDSIAAEMLRRTSIFQEKLDERNLHQHAILHSAFMSLYWQVQHGIALSQLSLYVEVNAEHRTRKTRAFLARVALVGQRNPHNYGLSDKRENHQSR